MQITVLVNNKIILMSNDTRNIGEYLTTQRNWRDADSLSEEWRDLRVDLRKQRRVSWTRKIRGERMETHEKLLRVITELCSWIASDVILDVQPEADPVSRHARVHRGCTRPQRIACFLRDPWWIGVWKNVLSAHAVDLLPSEWTLFKMIPFFRHPFSSLLLLFDVSFLI